MSGARTAIVTGGASGIGAACVRRFLKDGISVVALDLNENLYQWFAFIFPDFYQKSKLVLKFKLCFLVKRVK